MLTQPLCSFGPELCPSAPVSIPSRGLQLLVKIAPFSDILWSCDLTKVLPESALPHSWSECLHFIGFSQLREVCLMTWWKILLHKRAAFYSVSNCSSSRCLENSYPICILGNLPISPTVVLPSYEVHWVLIYRMSTLMSACSVVSNSLQPHGL